MIDLFEHPEQWPPELAKVCEKWEQCETYDDCENFFKDCEKIGYTLESGLDASPFNLRKL